jgi:hypothetical protein
MKLTYDRIVLLLSINNIYYSTFQYTIFIYKIKYGKDMLPPIDISINKFSYWILILFT